MEHTLLPQTIRFEASSNPHVGTAIISPCQQGFGTTMGNALRRVLLSRLSGSAVESVKVVGVQHEFSAIDGAKEDMIELILNLKQVAVRCHSNEPVMLHVEKKGPGVLTAGDFEKNADVEIMNPDHVLLNLTKNSKVEMDIIVGKGSGYVPVGEKELNNAPLGTTLIDSLYTPVRDVGYKVENTRVGDVTDYEELRLTVETNGTISPKEAIEQAAQILIDHFSLVLNIESGDAPVEAKEEAPEESAEEEA